MAHTWRALAVAVLAAAVGPGPAPAQAPLTAERQVELLSAWWTGDWDNFRQVLRQSGGSFVEPVYAPHPHVHGVYRAADVPALGPHVLYAAERVNDDPAKDAVRLYVLSPDDGGVRVSYYTLNDASKALADAETLAPDLAALKSVTASDVTPFRAACNIVLRHDGERFFGRSASRDCTFRDGGYYVYEITVRPDYYGLREHARSLADDAVVWEAAPGAGFGDREMLKARPAACTAALGARGGGAAPPPVSLTLHSEGGTAPLALFPGAPPFLVMLHGAPNGDHVLSLIDTTTGLPMAANTAPADAGTVAIGFAPFLDLTCRLG
ncbi:MAG: CpcT/CpeT family chromophore lyase [Rhodospirillaceae bacterium]|nr:CpcT/CpeT family chromophore lyase [Rhodospirillaceae bacterium]